MDEVAYERSIALTVSLFQFGLFQFEASMRERGKGRRGVVRPQTDSFKSSVHFPSIAN